MTSAKALISSLSLTLLYHLFSFTPSTLWVPLLPLLQYDKVRNYRLQSAKYIVQGHVVLEWYFCFKIRL